MLYFLNIYPYQLYYKNIISLKIIKGRIIILYIIKNKILIMKKLLSILLLFFSVIISCQNVTYQSLSSSIPNPEKGFYHYTSTGSSGGYNLLTQSTLNGYRTNENITVIQRQFFLRDFITGTPITSTYLTNMQTDFNRIRATGAKVIVRFTYTSSSSFTVFQPTKAQILSHITQLAPVINANKDVIVSIQAGFIGKYGEWYYTGSSEFGDGNFTVLTTTQWKNRKQVMNKMVSSFDSSIPLQVRYVFAKQKMYGNTFIGRIGFYNDSFLGTWGDSGTFVVNSSQGVPSTADVTYWQNNTINNPVSGETNMVNSPRTDCANATIEMNKFNWSLINKDYFPTVISNWQTNGCFSTIQKSIGYDFRLNSSNITNGILTINMGNYGYANVFKDRKAFLVCKNTTTNVNYSFVIDNNIKNIRTSNYNITTNLTTLGLPAGTYKLYLNLPDPFINNKLYSIQTSNLNTWTTEGFNDLQQTFIVSTLNIVNKRIQLQDDEISNVKVYNFNGSLISENLDLSELPEGLYIIVAKTTSNTIITKKIKI